MNSVTTRLLACIFGTSIDSVIRVVAAVDVVKRRREKKNVEQMNEIFIFSESL